MEIAPTNRSLTLNNKADRGHGASEMTQKDVQQPNKSLQDLKAIQYYYNVLTQENRSLGEKQIPCTQRP